MANPEEFLSFGCGFYLPALAKVAGEATKKRHWVIPTIKIDRFIQTEPFLLHMKSWIWIRSRWTILTFSMHLRISMYFQPFRLERTSKQTPGSANISHFSGGTYQLTCSETCTSRSAEVGSDGLSAFCRPTWTIPMMTRVFWRLRDWALRHWLLCKNSIHRVHLGLSQIRTRNH